MFFAYRNTIHEHLRVCATTHRRRVTTSSERLDFLVRVVLLPIASATLQLVAFWDNALANVDHRGVWYTTDVLADIRVGQHCGDSTCTSCIVVPFMVSRLRWSAQLAYAINQNAVGQSWTATAALMTSAFRQFCVVRGGSEGVYVADVAEVSRSDNTSSTRGHSQVQGLSRRC